MRVAQYQGVSAISKLIRWQTRSLYSHTAFLFDDGSVVEAWASPYPGMVRHVKDLSEQHTPGTVVDIFEFKDPLTVEENIALEFRARDAVGLHYDYKGIVRFLTRQRSTNSKAVFCSELVYRECHRIGRPLMERTEAWRVPPDWIPRSPLLTFSTRIVTT